jgi:hypothetical protein
MECFMHGQLYTVLSRVCGQRDIQVLFHEDVEEMTVNVVYKHLLL